MERERKRINPETIHNNKKKRAKFTNFQEKRRNKEKKAGKEAENKDNTEQVKIEEERQ